ncbi:glycoside hydrolase superfamily [Mycena rosella]|uniref:glucan 1,3-beta-glucosidase n=1 Tax=Mycena rosella TaxID=1033263 RepID=A0AAD7DKC9_MYCRO|nr:glycoside hydrolase superfamily [Mycena rosella]
MHDEHLPTTPYTDFPQPQPPYARDSGAPSRTESPADSYRDYPPTSPNNSAQLLPTSAAAPHAVSGKEYGTGYGATASRKSPRSRRLLGLGVLAGVIVVVLAVVLPVYFLVIKKHNDNAAASSSSSGTGSSSGTSGGDNSGGKGVVGAVTGGDGSTVTTANGDTFMYNNSFGGYWLADPQNPFASGARANSWTPPLNESWTWGVDRVYGVNLGGWFVLEPFIAPSLFQAYPDPADLDEWSLTTLMRADGTLQAKLEAHYDTFITEQDIAQIAGAGLNWVRLPIPFWAVSTWSDVGTDGNGPVAEPFLEGVCWKYIVRLLGWARKYGIRVNIDLHTAPGSQNGYNHSGKDGQINFLNGPMGVANAQRMLDYIRVIAEFVSQPEYREVVGMFGLINEARMAVIGRPQLSAFYLEAHNMIRAITGFGAGNGPYISVHDGFQAVSSWAGFLPGSDRVILDTHPYFAFSGQPNDQPIATSEDPTQAGGRWPKAACDAWQSSIDTSRSAFGVTVAGEFSNGYNDCGLFVTKGTPTYGGDCSLWEDASTWNATVKEGVLQFALASMDAMGDWFFWTWKIGQASNGVVRAPLWSYQLGLEGGWMPTDPRTSVGKCVALGDAGPKFDGTFSAWQTGGAGAGTIAAAASASFGVWPPLTISNVAASVLTMLPTYTATGSVPTLVFTTPSVTGSAPAATVTPTVSAGDGWFDKGDTAPAMTAVAGCTYPDAWNALSLPAPTALCTGA